MAAPHVTGRRTPYPGSRVFLHENRSTKQAMHVLHKPTTSTPPSHTIHEAASPSETARHRRRRPFAATLLELTRLQANASRLRQHYVSATRTCSPPLPSPAPHKTVELEALRAAQVRGIVLGLGQHWGPSIWVRVGAGCHDRRSLREHGSSNASLDDIS